MSDAARPPLHMECALRVAQRFERQMSDALAGLEARMEARRRLTRAHLARYDRVAGRPS